MYTAVINIKSLPLDKVRSFVSIVSRFDLDIDLKAGNRMVDGKSFLGIMTLDLGKPMKLCLVSNEYEEITKLTDKLSRTGFV